MMFGFGFLWLILIVAVLAYLMGWRPEKLNLDGLRQGREEKAPLEIVKARYARGEITKEEFERVRADLER